MQESSEATLVSPYSVACDVTRLASTWTLCRYVGQSFDSQELSLQNLQFWNCFADKWAMAGSSFALDSLDRNDLALDLLDTEGLFGEQQLHSFSLVKNQKMLLKFHSLLCTWMLKLSVQFS